MLAEHSIREHRMARTTPLIKKRAWLLVLLVGLMAWVASHVVQHGQLPFLRRESIWSIAVYEGPSPLSLQASTEQAQPILTAAHVTDVDALFVADPFVVHHEGSAFMFFEVLNRDEYQGDIGLARSDDGGVTWQYDRIILDEEFHLSYPSVFAWQGRWFMVPDCERQETVRLYEARDFPHSWEFKMSLVETHGHSDATVFRHDERWWMFAGSLENDALRLFSSEDLFGGWSEHPRSPLLTSAPDTARPGGRVFAYQDRLYRLAQDCEPRYGNQLRAFEIITLSQDDYEERPHEHSVLTPGTTAWNNVGMHHCDPHRLAEGRWRGYVDGHTKRWVLRAWP